MSSIKLTADSGGGTFEIKAPSSSGNTRVLTIPDETATLLTSATSTGKILQVKSVTKSDTFSSTGTTAFVDVTGLSVDITPASASNKILVLYDLNWSSTGGHFSCRMLRDGVSIKVGDTAGSNRPRATGQVYFSGNDKYDITQQAGTFLDSPNSTSSVTYKWQVGTPASTGYTIYVNRQGAEDNGDQLYNGRVASSMTLMEVAA